MHRCVEMVSMDMLYDIVETMSWYKMNDLNSLNDNRYSVQWFDSVEEDYDSL